MQNPHKNKIELLKTCKKKGKGESWRWEDKKIDEEEKEEEGKNENWEKIKHGGEYGIN